MTCAEGKPRISSLLTCCLALQVHKRSLWTVEPSDGMVPPDTEVQLTLTANLNDTVTFKDMVILEIENSITYQIPVQASGIGCTILSDKLLTPELNLGAHFRYGNITDEFL